MLRVECDRTLQAVDRQLGVSSIEQQRAEITVCRGHVRIALDRAAKLRDGARFVPGFADAFGKRIVSQRIARHCGNRAVGMRKHASLIAFATAARRQDQVRGGQLFGVDRRDQARLARPPRARDVTGQKKLPRALDAAGTGHRLPPRCACGCACANASSYAASSARVCRGMSVSVECASPALMAALTADMNPLSVASRTAMST